MRAARVAETLIIAGTLGAVAPACTLNTEGLSVGQRDAGIPPDAEPPSACQGEPSDCNDSVPAGWTRVGFAIDRAEPCEEGLTAVDLLADPTPMAGACSCGDCMITAQPSCSGLLFSLYDADPNIPLCLSVGYPVGPENVGKCVPLMQGLQVPWHLAEKPTVSAAGTCTLMPAADQSAVAALEARLCVPREPSCEAKLCPSTSGFTECILADGVKACPEGPFTTAHALGTGTETLCSPCGCNVKTTCGGTLNLYADTGCTTTLATVTTDGTCQKLSAGPYFNSVRYDPKVESATCDTSAPSTPTLTLTAPQTLCCK